MDTEPSPLETVSIRGGTLGGLLAGLAWVGLLFTAGLVLLGRFDRAPGNLLTGLLFFLPHLWALHGALVFGAWCLLPDRRTFPAVLTASLLGALALWGPGMATWTSDSGGARVRMLSWNVQRLWGGPGEALAPACVRDVILREDPDVVAFMEVSRDNLKQLEGSGLDCVHTTYTRRDGDQRGGLAVCGRRGWRVTGSGERFVGMEDWRFLATEVNRGEDVFNVFAVHLMPHHFGATASETERVAAKQANQSAALIQRVGRLRDPTIVAGDFNSTRDFYLHVALRRVLVDAWERGGLGYGATKYVWGWLPLRIDFVYVSQEFSVLDTRVEPEECSDHLPVSTTLVLPEG